MKKTSIMVLFFLILFSACSVWENFTTYFNRYYNAKVEFEQAEKIYKETGEGIFEFKRVKPLGAADKLLEGTVKKCSKILQFNSKSDYVKDALFLIGKAFYYQGNFLKANRKFVELNAMKSEKYFWRTKYWLGKTKLHIREVDRGLKLLQQVADTSVSLGDEELASEAYIAITAYYIHYKNFEKAISNILKAIKYSDDDVILAELYYELGKQYLEINDIKLAARSFDKVKNYSPRIQIEVESNIEAARLKRELGLIEESIYDFENLRDEEKYKKFYDKLDLEIGIGQFENKDFINSFAMFEMVDTTYKNSPSAGIARYYLAEILSSEYRMYDSSLVYYKRVTNSLAPLEYQNLAQKKVRLFTDYVTEKEKLKTLKKQITYLENPLIFQQDSLRFEQIRKEDSTKLANDALERGITLTKRQIETKQKYTLKIKKPEKSKLDISKLKKNLWDAKSKLANLFFTEAEQFDSAGYYYSQLLVEYPDSLRNGSFYYTIATFYDAVNKKHEADSLFNIVYEKYKHERIANNAADRLNKPKYNFDFDPAKKHFYSAEKLYDQKKYLQALDTLTYIYKSFKQSAFAPKSLYFKGWIYKNDLKNFDSLLNVYRTLDTAYATTEYARKIRSELAIYEADIKRKIQKAKADSIKALMKDSLQLTSDSTATDSLKNMSDSLKLKVDSLKNNSKELKLKNNKKEILKKGFIPEEDENDDVERRKKNTSKLEKENKISPEKQQKKKDSVKKDSINREKDILKKKLKNESEKDPL